MWSGRTTSAAAAAAARDDGADSMLLGRGGGDRIDGVATSGRVGYVRRLEMGRQRTNF